MDEDSIKMINKIKINKGFTNVPLSRAEKKQKKSKKKQCFKGKARCNVM